MKFFFRKLIFGKTILNKKPTQTAIERRIENIKSIWNNDHHDDIGIEKIFRLFLACSQFLFLGIYIKNIFGKKGNAYQDVCMDIYVLFKLTFPVFILYFNLQNHLVFLVLLIWFMIETILYIPTLIFASDSFLNPRSYRRSMFLLFINYLEIDFDFAVLYSTGNYFNQIFINWFDAIYFSITTSATIGFGDIFPITTVGKFLVCSQALIALMFVVLFLNFFNNKLESKGYFGKN